MHLVLIPPHDLDYFAGITTLTELPEEVPKTIQFNVNGYNFNAVARITMEDPKDIFAEEEICDTTDMGEGRAATILARLHDIDKEAVSCSTANGAKLGEDEYKNELDAILSELETVAQFTGTPIELVADAHHRMHPPRDTTNTLFVVLGCSAPGPMATRSLSYLFGIPVCERGYVVRVPAATDNIGYVVYNALEEPIAQVVGRTIYLFVPQNSFALKQMAGDETKLFNRVWSAAWNAFLVMEGKSPGTSKQVETPERLGEVTLNPADSRKRLHADIEEAEDEIQAAQLKMANALAKKRDLLVTIRGLESLGIVDPKESWEKLNTSPYLAQVLESHHGGAYYHTKPLIIPDEDGVDRFVGGIGLQIKPSGDISAWSLDHPHHSGIPHPHISTRGSVCLGNVTQAVGQLIAELKEAETAVLVMRLLAEGYDPDLAEHKLNEWPTPEEFERRKKRESVTPTPYVEREPDSLGESSGSRPDWVLRDLLPGARRSA